MGQHARLAYAVRFPERITEMILFGVTTGRHAEFDWLFRGGVAVLFPEQWERLRAAAPLAESDRDVVDAYHRLLYDADAEVQQRARLRVVPVGVGHTRLAAVAGLSTRFRDCRFALAFARLVTHYVRHNAWLEDGRLFAGVEVLADTPGVL